jgi:hypothetical protein
MGVNCLLPELVGGRGSGGNGVDVTLRIDAGWSHGVGTPGHAAYTSLPLSMPSTDFVISLLKKITGS